MPTDPMFTNFLTSCGAQPPRVAVVLGSGLGHLADGLDTECAVPFGAVPEMEPTTVAGHKGELRLGTWAGTRVLLFVGRLHYYEGHSWRRVEQPIQTAHALGAQILLVTNAAGGIRDDLVPGNLMPIQNHIDWTRPFKSALAKAEPCPYSPRLVATLNKAAAETGVALKPGTYAQVTGPCYETPAEIRAMRAAGADVVGMSTCREVARGHALGMECAALSLVTNRAAGLNKNPICHEEVVAAGLAAGEHMAKLLAIFLTTLD